MKKVTDRLVQYPNRYRLVKVADEEDVYDLIPIEGEVLEEGTRIDATLFDSIAKDVNKLKGRAGTVAVEQNITPLSPTQSPIVENMGTDTDARLKFSLPVGVKVNDVSVEYAVSASGSEIPQGWKPEIKTAPQGSYLWTRYIVNFTDGTQSRIYSSAYQGVDGKNGANGANGTSVTVSSTTTEYTSSTSGTTIPQSSWQSTVPTVAQGSYLWTKVTTTFSDGKTATSYTASRQGKDGAKGETGDTGATGNGIQSIKLQATSGKTKTYRITYTDGNHFDFSLDDGETPKIYGYSVRISQSKTNITPEIYDFLINFWFYHTQDLEITSLSDLYNALKTSNLSLLPPVTGEISLYQSHDKRAIISYCSWYGNSTIHVVYFIADGYTRGFDITDNDCKITVGKITL